MLKRQSKPLQQRNEARLPAQAVEFRIADADNPHDSLPVCILQVTECRICLSYTGKAHRQIIRRYVAALREWAKDSSGCLRSDSSPPAAISNTK